jgi:hypothetical protein
MATTKNWCEEREGSSSAKMLLESASSCLQCYLDTLEEDSAEHKQLSFLCEQIRLHRLNKHARHYPPDVILFAYSVHSTSSAAYKVRWS